MPSNELPELGREIGDGAGRKEAAAPAVQRGGEESFDRVVRGAQVLFRMEGIELSGSLASLELEDDELAWAKPSVQVGMLGPDEGVQLVERRL